MSRQPHCVVHIFSVLLVLFNCPSIASAQSPQTPLELTSEQESQQVDPDGPAKLNAARVVKFQGTIVMQIIISKEGSIANAEILKGVPSASTNSLSMR